MFTVFGVIMWRLVSMTDIFRHPEMPDISSYVRYGLITAQVPLRSCQLQTISMLSDDKTLHRLIPLSPPPLAHPRTKLRLTSTFHLWSPDLWLLTFMHCIYTVWYFTCMCMRVSATVICVFLAEGKMNLCYCDGNVSVWTCLDLTSGANGTKEIHCYKLSNNSHCFSRHEIRIKENVSGL